MSSSGNGSGEVKGRKIVLCASDSESSEYLKSTWRQMLLATLPAKYAKAMGTDINFRNEVWPDGQAKYVPHGLRIIESLLLQKFSADDIAVCYPNQMHLFIGTETKVVGLHAHNPLGITFATDIYAHFYGADADPVNAAEFKRMILHPVLRRHQPHLKIIVGGPGSWQIEKGGVQDEWLVDCIVEGEAEEKVLGLFEQALRGEPLPRKMVVEHSPPMEKIPRIRHRSTFGVVEITRGCGRGCQFCSVALRGGKSIPLPQILDNVRAQVAEGADTILFTTEDLFLYEQGPKFETNVPALKRLFQSVSDVDGVKHIMLTHGTISPVVRDPWLLDEITPLAVGKSINQHPDSTHPENRYANLFIGLETGSIRVFKQYMKGKCYPYRPEQWPDVVMKGMELLNRYNWFPFCTFILGMPGETDQDTRDSLDLLFSLKDSKWCVLPTLFVPFEETRLGKKEGASIFKLTDLQWEFFFTCWRYNIDFFRREPKVQWKFNLGIPFYYYLMGRRMFGPAMKYPLYRLAHFPEWYLRRKLYLDYSGRMQPRHTFPEQVEVPPERARVFVPLDSLGAASPATAD